MWDVTGAISQQEGVVLSSGQTRGWGHWMLFLPRL